MASTRATNQGQPARPKLKQPQHHRTYSTFSARSSSSKEGIVRPAANVKPVLRMPSSEDTALLWQQKKSKALVLQKPRNVADLDLEANRSSKHGMVDGIDWEKWLFLALIALVYMICLGLLWKTQRDYLQEHGGCWWNCDHPEKDDGPTAG